MFQQPLNGKRSLHNADSLSLLRLLFLNVIWRSATKVEELRKKLTWRIRLVTCGGPDWAVGGARRTGLLFVRCRRK